LQRFPLLSAAYGFDNIDGISIAVSGDLQLDKNDQVAQDGYRKLRNAMGLARMYLENVQELENGVFTWIILQYTLQGYTMSYSIPQSVSQKELPVVPSSIGMSLDIANSYLSIRLSDEFILHIKFDLSKLIEVDASLNYFYSLSNRKSSYGDKELSSLQISASKSSQIIMNTTSCDKIYTDGCYVAGEFLISTSFLKSSVILKIKHELKYESTSDLLPAIQSYVSLLDIVLVVALFSLCSFLLIQMMRKVYYVLFTQINLFTYKLMKFNEEALGKAGKFSGFRIEELIFTRDNEIKELFELFFYKFKENSRFHNTDIQNTMMIKSSSTQFSSDSYSMRFSENLMNPLLGAITVRTRRRNATLLAE